MIKSVTILGSTGSIGLSSLRVVKYLDKEYSVYGLSCKQNISLLTEQIKEFNPKVVALESKDILVTDEYKSLKKKYKNVEFLEGEEGIIELAKRPVDILVSAIVGAAGLKPGLSAIKGAKRIALANKETLVMAGDLFLKSLAQNNVEMIPVDSEHSAIFSLLQNISASELKRIILTASGGSLRDLDFDSLKDVTPEIALKHPTWSMGNKITIDSATLINKGLEIIEAHYLFNTDYDDIDIIIHPESVVHSMIETVDGAIYSHMGVTDMALPILNSFTYPEKIKNEFGRLDLHNMGNLSFSAYDSKKYPAVELCYAVGREGGIMPALLNGANEVAVNAFLEKKILFTDIVAIIEKVLNQFSNIKDPGIEDVFQADIEARKLANSFI